MTSRNVAVQDNTQLGLEPAGRGGGHWLLAGKTSQTSHHGAMSTLLRIRGATTELSGPMRCPHPGCIPTPSPRPALGKVRLLSTGGVFLNASPA